MKTLIFLLLFTTPTFATQEVPEVAQGIATQVKDIEIEDVLKNSEEFASCRNKYKFEASDNQQQRTTKLRDAQKCFKEKMSSDKTRLEKLSDTLGLQSFGLVKGKTVADIQEYFNNKMYKELTGVDPKEESIETKMNQLKFKNKKQIDQSIFFELYKTQLSKNALYEVSRFCFQNLRLNDNYTGTNSFGEHWRNFPFKSDPNGAPTSDRITKADVSDSGDGLWGVIKDPTDKNSIYKDIFNGIKVNQGNTLTTAKMKDFFMWCGQLIVPMCEDFRNSSKIKIGDNDTESVIADAPKKGDPRVQANMSNGAEACLSKNRLQGIRSALMDLEKITDKMKEDYEVPPEYMAKLFRGETINLYVPGENGASSLDSLTNASSSDILNGSNQKFDDAEDCEKSNGDKDKCKNFYADSEEVEKAKVRVELEMTAKREVEMARVRELKAKGQQGLEEYLKEQGMYDLVEKLKEPGGIDKIEELVGKEMEARKVATIEAIQNRMGKRQSSKDGSQPSAADTMDIVRASKEEKARLAQVVLFNNIITSSLELKREDGSDAGKNTSAWAKEEKELKQANVDTSLFSNLQITTGGGSSSGPAANEQIGGLGLIEKLLGDKSQDENKGQLRTGNRRSN